MPTFILATTMLLAQNGNAPPQPSLTDMLRLYGLPMLMIMVVFYFLMIRPERRKQAEQTRMLQSLKKNDRVVTIGGIHGTIVNASPESDEVTIKVDESTNTKLRMQRSAIARVLASETATTPRTES